MKKRYDAVIIGGGLAGYALAALTARHGHVLLFESDEPPVEPPWHRPLLGMGENSVWARFEQELKLSLPAASRFRLQHLAGRERSEGYDHPAPEPFDSTPWIDEQLTWRPWYQRMWQSLRTAPQPPRGEAWPWLSHPVGYAATDPAVLRYLASVTDSLATPGEDFVQLLRTLRAEALREGTEFLPLNRLDAVVRGQGVRVEGVGATLLSPRIAVCLDLGEWTQTPGLGPIPRVVFRRVRQQGVRVRVRWYGEDMELPVGLAARGWWDDAPPAFYEVFEEGEQTVLSVWTICDGGAEVDSSAEAERLLAVVKRYCPFFKGSPDSARVDAQPVWVSRARSGQGVRQSLAKGLVYAGPQSFPGWGAEGELVAALRTCMAWFPPEGET